MTKFRKLATVIPCFEFRAQTPKRQRQRVEELSFRILYECDYVTANANNTVIINNVVIKKESRKMNLT